MSGIGNASLPELLWTVFGLVGVAINLWAAVDAIADLHYLQARGVNGARELAARGAAVDEGLRFVIQVVFVAIGLFAMTQAAPTHDGNVTATGVVVAGGLIVAEVILVIKSVLARRRRKQLLALLMGGAT